MKSASGLSQENSPLLNLLLDIQSTRSELVTAIAKLNALKRDNGAAERQKLVFECQRLDNFLHLLSAEILRSSTAWGAG
jgi:hypothetical protein